MIIHESRARDLSKSIPSIMPQKVFSQNFSFVGGCSAEES